MRVLFSLKYCLCFFKILLSTDLEARGALIIEVVEPVIRQVYILTPLIRRRQNVSRSRLNVKTAEQCNR